MKTFILEHKKLCIAILAMLLVLIVLLLCWVFRPKLSTLSDWELKIFLSLNGLEEWGTNDISAVREYIVKIEENPNYLPLINAFKKEEMLFAKLNKAVNRYYSRPFIYQYIIDDYSDLLDDVYGEGERK